MDGIRKERNETVMAGLRKEKLDEKGKAGMRKEMLG